MRHLNQYFGTEYWSALVGLWQEAAGIETSKQRTLRSETVNNQLLTEPEQGAVSLSDTAAVVTETNAEEVDGWPLPTPYKLDLGLARTIRQAPKKVAAFLLHSERDTPRWRQETIAEADAREQASAADVGQAIECKRLSSKSSAFRPLHKTRSLRASSVNDPHPAFSGRSDSLDLARRYVFTDAVATLTKAPGARPGRSRGTVGGGKGRRNASARSAGAGPATLEVRLVGGRRIGVAPGFDEVTLGRLVRLLEGL